VSAIPVAIPAPSTTWELPSRGRMGMFSLVAAESTILPIFATVCLLSSSLTIHLAVVALGKGRVAAFTLLWGMTAALGAIFLVGTGVEWYRMIDTLGFTIRTNLFGTTYYSLVGLHASHVTVGLIGLAIVLGLALAGKVRQEHAEKCEVFSIYWHFVDAVWVVVFTVVYIVGR
jgi:cytochrome c oxidase subunit III